MSEQSKRDEQLYRNAQKVYADYQELSGGGSEAEFAAQYPGTAQILGLGGKTALMKIPKAGPATPAGLAMAERLMGGLSVPAPRPRAVGPRTFAGEPPDEASESSYAYSSEPGKVMGSLNLDEVRKYVEQGMAEIGNIPETSGIAESQIANYDQAAEGVRAAGERYARPDSKFYRIADPAARIATVLAYLADISSGKPGRRRTAAGKMGAVMEQIEAIKQGRAAKKRSQYETELGQVQSMLGLAEKKTGAQTEEAKRQTEGAKEKSGAAMTAAERIRGGIIAGAYAKGQGSQKQQEIEWARKSWNDTAQTILAEEEKRTGVRPPLRAIIPLIEDRNPMAYSTLVGYKMMMPAYSAAWQTFMEGSANMPGRANWTPEQHLAAFKQSDPRRWLELMSAQGQKGWPGLQSKMSLEEIIGMLGKDPSRGLDLSDPADFDKAVEIARKMMGLSDDRRGTTEPEPYDPGAEWWRENMGGKGPVAP